MKLRHITGAVALAGAAAVLAAPAQADNVADFYKGKTITIYIGYGAGGGYDRYGRMLSRFMGAHIPGKPDMIAKNMPGAGSMILANALYNTLPKDGTAMGIIGRGIAMEPLFGRPGPKFDALKFNWIGSMNNAVSVCAFWHEAKAKTIYDAMKHPVILAATAQGSDGVDFPVILNNIIGTKFKLIAGYPGGSSQMIAMERGEVDGRCGWSWGSVKTTRPQWIKNHEVNITLQIALKGDPQLNKMGVPLVMDLAKTPRDKKILSLIFSRQTMGRPFLAPPDVPADRVAALRAAFEATMKDPKMLAQAEKLRVEISPVSGEEIDALLKDVYASPKDIVEAAARATDYSRTKIQKKEFPLITDTGEITKIANGGREVSFKLADGSDASVSVSGSKTKVTVGGSKAKRSALKVGMTCEVEYKGSGTRAKTIACK